MSILVTLAKRLTSKLLLFYKSKFVLFLLAIPDGVGDDKDTVFMCLPIQFTPAFKVIYLILYILYLFFYLLNLIHF